MALTKEKENRIREFVEKVNQSSEVFNANTRALYEAIENATAVAKNYPRNTLYAIAANGKAFTFIGPSGIKYQILITENARRLLSDDHSDNPRIWTRYITTGDESL